MMKASGQVSDRRWETIRSQLEEAIKASKCHRCGCFLGLVRAIERGYPTPELPRSLIQEARAVAREEQYECLGCAVCWPAVANNVLAELDPSLSEDARDCPSGVPAVREGWPPLPGDYRVLRYHAPVAVCTLNSDELMHRLVRRAPEGLAIVGTLRTENLGIERMILNTIANPNVRFLILCGEDGRQRIGHLPGHSLISLFKHGLDERSRIRNAPGKRPLLRNVRRLQAENFIHQVSFVNRIGESDDFAIEREIGACAARWPGPFEGGSDELPIKSVEVGEPGRLVLDPAGYFVIYPVREQNRLTLEHYTKEGVLDCVLQGNSPAALYCAAIERGLVSRLDHAAYLGCELTRAEHCLRTGAVYIQDRAPGEPKSPAPNAQEI